jgi:hypothetical protein
MKRYILIIIQILIVSQVKCQTDFKDFWEQMKDTIVEKHLIDIDSDNQIDTAIFRFPTNYDHPEFGYTDPGVFSILDLRLSTSQNILIEECFDSLPEKPFKGFDNDFNSKFAFLSDFKTSNKYLFLTGPSYGCCMEQTYIFEIKENNVKLISSSQLSLIEIVGFDKDDFILVIGYDKQGEDWGGYETDYAFHHLIFPTVFRINDTLVKDNNLTYKYNPNLKEKFGDFISYTRPVVVKDMINKTEFLEEFDNIEGNYYRKYDMTSRFEVRESAFEEYSKEELRIMRNEIFAAHGYIFKSADLRDYFSKTKWYNPRFQDVTDKLTDIEKHNIQLILKYEKQK